MRKRSQTFTDLPLNIVGSDIYGRYPKISQEQTYNMIISDDFLVPFSGHKKVVNISNVDQGRGLFTSARSKTMIAVIGHNVYKINEALIFSFVGALDTFNGDVFIDENEKQEIAICDLEGIYIFNYALNTFNKAVIDFVPGYISYQDGRFISVDTQKPQWRLCDIGNSLSWPPDQFHVGAFQSKPDIPVAALRFPGKGNLLMVFGSTITLPFYDVGNPVFPYQLTNSSNIDYGCLNPATIAANGDIMIWLGANEKSGPVIMFSDGGEVRQISTDGINFKLAQLANPNNSYGFLVKQDGHLLYQLTFPSPEDDLTILYDFNTQKFFTLCNENMGAHIAKRVVFFNNNYYFISFVDGNIYELNSSFTTFDGNIIPRIRICKNIRLPDASRFIANNLTFTLEQGESDEVQAVDLSISKDGGESFSSSYRKYLNPQAVRRNRLIYWQLGAANDFVAQFRFWGKGRFVATDGLVSIHQ